MGMVAHLAKNAFKKIFKNLAKELQEPVENIQLGIYYPDGCKFEAYKNFEKVKDIALDSYIGRAIDFTGGTAAIEMTIAEAGPRFVKELSEKLNREVSVGEVNIIMKYNEDKLPIAVLLCDGQKQRVINIETEFLNS